MESDHRPSPGTATFLEASTGTRSALIVLAMSPDDETHWPVAYVLLGDELMWMYFIEGIWFPLTRGPLNADQEWHV